jgi:phage gp46-like protein
MAGIGGQGVGGSPYGVGTPAVQEDLGGKVLTQDTTNKQTGSRYIDPSTGDYVLDDTARIAGMDDVKQLVFLRVKTSKGSAAHQRLGHELRKIDRITSNIQRRVEATLTEALQDLIDDGMIQVLGVTVQVARPGVVFARLQWRNLLTDLDDEESVLLTG